MPPARSRPGLTWGSFASVMSKTSVFDMDRDADSPWAGPAGDCWRFWNQVCVARRAQPAIRIWDVEDAS